jgi:UPF0755 protein
MDFLKRNIPWMIAFVLAVSIVGGYEYLFSAPASFQSGSIVQIAHGTPVPEIAKELADAHIIAHPTLLRALLRLSGQSTAVQTGVYKFEKPQNLFTIAYRLWRGEYDMPLVRITFIEATTVREMAVQVESAFPGILAKDFLSAASGQEGYLFPDTYFLQPSMDAKTLVAHMRANFDTKIAPLQSEITASGHSLSDIVTMASLVEKEGRTSAVRRIVAGILWNRITHNMPLQVDAVFGYIFNRATYSPSFADLKFDSPYNTYMHIGLPPGPIDNPSLDSLEATVNPTKTSYLYYLTDKNGVMHYATTYAGHQSNQKKYLQ